MKTEARFWVFPFTKENTKKRYLENIWPLYSPAQQHGVFPSRYKPQSLLNLDNVCSADLSTRDFFRTEHGNLLLRKEFPSLASPWEGGWISNRFYLEALLSSLGLFLFPELYPAPDLLDTAFRQSTCTP